MPKKYPPFEKTSVPESAIVAFILKTPHTVEAMYQDAEKYRAVNREWWKNSRSVRHKAWKTFRAMWHNKAIDARLLAELNYLDTTISSGTALWRVFKVYQKHRDKIFKIHSTP